MFNCWKMTVWFVLVSCSCPWHSMNTWPPHALGPYRHSSATLWLSSCGCTWFYHQISLKSIAVRAISLLFLGQECRDPESLVRRYGGNRVNHTPTMMTEKRRERVSALPRHSPRMDVVRKLIYRKKERTTQELMLSSMLELKLATRPRAWQWGQRGKEV